MPNQGAVCADKGCTKSQYTAFMHSPKVRYNLSNYLPYLALKLALLITF